MISNELTRIKEMFEKSRADIDEKPKQVEQQLRQGEVVRKQKSQTEKSE